MLFILCLDLPQNRKFFCIVDTFRNISLTTRPSTTNFRSYKYLSRVGIKPATRLTAVSPLTTAPTVLSIHMNVMRSLQTRIESVMRKHLIGPTRYLRMIYALGGTTSGYKVSPTTMRTSRSDSSIIPFIARSSYPTKLSSKLADYSGTILIIVLMHFSRHTKRVQSNLITS